MNRFPWVAGAAALAICALGVGTAGAQKLEATVLYRQNSDATYTPSVPGYSESDVDCAADVTNEVCSEQRQSDRSSVSALNVVGTTVSLQLPDGRVAVLNCVNKYSYKGTGINRRTCAMPLVAQVEAEFNGPSAKLKWLVGQDGKKTESETYKVVAIFDKRASKASPPAAEASASEY
ncbi:MAG TPA: hypothetical protein VK716_13375 [Terracidiphilus sp.]|jgi:hypothetical protein|nr:hypothetical protein [Terracidiphilus sp.]